MTTLFSMVPVLNRLLEIAQAEAAKKGHVIEKYDREKKAQETIYFSECIICHATVKLICSASQYKRFGTAYGRSCKPG